MSTLNTAHVFYSAVYFNPAKTVGAMIEADLFCLLGMLYASLVCLVSMNMFWWFEVQPGWEWAADLIALSWIGLSFGAMAWMKVWMVRLILILSVCVIIILSVPAGKSFL